MRNKVWIFQPMPERIVLDRESWSWVQLRYRFDYKTSGINVSKLLGSSRVQGSDAESSPGSPNWLF